jgi:hypothetical protein
LRRPRAAFIVPCAKLGCVTDLHCPTIVSCDHETDCLILWDCDYAGEMNHEVVVATLLEWFTVKVAIDVVF